MLSFGTDGVRGVANAELTPELALALGRCAGRVLGGSSAVIGRDPRRSGPMLEAALAAGLASEGLDVILLGIAPTPAVAHASARLGITGAVISASHNPFPDNGIKLFAPGGHKLSDEVEARLEVELARVLSGADDDRPTGVGVGRIRGDAGGLLSDYQQSVRDALGGRRLDGVRVVLDCAHGAGSLVAPEVLASLGADVTVLHADPDGTNVNAGAGSTAPEVLRAAVLEHGAEVGLALDGDADRLVAVDAAGNVVDGDHLIAVLAIDRRHRGELPADTVVVTVMSNLGFRRAMEAHGIRVVETSVGDRSVLAGLRAHGATLGGEQSGHIIQTDLATTGDGLLSAATLLDVVVRTGRSLEELASAMTSLPQVLVNVTTVAPSAELEAALEPALDEVRRRLGDAGRVLVRPSGTEPVLRIMVEAPTYEQARAEAEALASVVELSGRAEG